MTSVQIRVAMVGFGPGVPEVNTTIPTYHLDLIPTLLDLVDAECSNPELFEGHSLIDKIPTGRILSSRGLGDPKYLFVQPNRKIGDEILGYLGFLNWRSRELAPGALVDPNAEAIDFAAAADWSNAELMRSWLAQRYGQSFADVPDDPLTVLHETIRSERKRTRLKTIELIRQLGDRAGEFSGDLEQCLHDVDPVIRQRAFDLIHDITRR